MIHDLKIWPVYLKPILQGIKTFEIRKDDRNFKVGDILHLRGWNPEAEIYTGLSAEVKIKYILWGDIMGLKDGYCIMSIKLI